MKDGGAAKKSVAESEMAGWPETEATVLDTEVSQKGLMRVGSTDANAKN